MRTYNRIKNMIIALLAAAFYCYSCGTAADHATGLIIFGTIGVFSAVFVIMIEFDLMFGTCRQRGRKG